MNYSRAFILTNMFLIFLKLQEKITYKIRKLATAIRWIIDEDDTASTSRLEKSF